MSAATVSLRRAARTGTATAVRVVVRGRRLREAAVVRAARADDAPAIHQLISTHRAEGHLLARTVEDVDAHVERFAVATVAGRIVGCVDLASLSAGVAEVRSLVVADAMRGAGIGRRLVNEVARRAAAAGVEQLCAFSHTPQFFLRLGFSIVPHTWLPEKIAADCAGCPQFRQCGQHAVVLSLVQAPPCGAASVSRHG